MSLFAELKRRNVLRVAAAYVVLSWLLLQVGDVLFETLELPSLWNKGLLALMVIGVIPVLIFAWVYELTPEGIKRESEVTREASVTGQTARKLDIAVLAMLAAVAALYFFDQRAAAPPVEGAGQTEIADIADATEIDSIAVLPFGDFSAAGDQAHLARGIADTVLHMLAQVPDLRVAARTSSFAYEGTNTPLDKVARELGVGAILEGSVQRSGERLRIIAQLIRASDQSHLWSETFDRTADDVFAIQDEIAHAVVAALRPNSSSEEGVPKSERTQVEAYEHYLKGKEARLRGTAESAELALAELRASLEIDPDFVPALVELGFSYTLLNAVTPRTWAEIEGPAEESFRRALDLAPDDPEALSGRGLLVLWAGYEPMAAKPYLERALALNPSDVNALVGLADLHFMEGNVAAGTDALRGAYELDPNNPHTALEYGELLTDLGRYGQARAIAQRLLVLRPNQPVGHGLLTSIERDRGRIDLAIPHALDQLETNPDSWDVYHQLANLYALLEDQATAQSWYERTPEEVQTEDYVPEILYLTAEGVARLKTQAERDLVLYPGWDAGQRGYVFYLFLNREIEPAVEAAERYEDALYTDFNRLVAAAAGALARRIGKQAMGNRLLDAARERLPILREAGYLLRSAAVGEAILAVADDQHDEAFAALQRYIDAGGIETSVFRLHPVFDPLRDDPRFDDFMNQLEAKAAEQLQRLREQGL